MLTCDNVTMGLPPCHLVPSGRQATFADHRDPFSAHHSPITTRETGSTSVMTSDPIGNTHRRSRWTGNG